MEAGRIDLAGSGVSISIPEGWTVEVASPDPDDAPELLEFALPARLDGVALKVLGYVGPDSLTLADGPLRPVLEQVLSDLGKTPDDLRMAAAWADTDGPTGRTLFDIAALRIDGVPGAVLGDLLIREVAIALGRDIPPDYEWRTVTIDEASS